MGTLFKQNTNAINVVSWKLANKTEPLWQKWKRREKEFWAKITLFLFPVECLWIIFGAFVSVALTVRATMENGWPLSWRIYFIYSFSFRTKMAEAKSLRCNFSPSRNKKKSLTLSIDGTGNKGIEYSQKNRTFNSQARLDHWKETLSQKKSTDVEHIQLFSMVRCLVCTRRQSSV